MTITVVRAMRFPLKDPILENLLADRNAFFRMAQWGLSTALIFCGWLAVSLSLALLAWRASVSDHALGAVRGPTAAETGGTDLLRACEALYDDLRRRAI